ncbi:MAG: metal-dependent hydrolase [Bacteroidota bacterium]
MRLGTHVTGGVLGYTVVATFFELPWTATGIVVAGLASTLPDVDTLGSTVGRVLQPLARRIESRVGHRTLTHCYAAHAVAALALLPIAWAGWLHLYAAALVGLVSHTFLDTLTVQGVRVWWPWSDRRGVFPYYNRQPTAYRTHTGSRADSALGVAFLCLTVPFGVVQHDGYKRLVRTVQADAGAAVRDFLDWSAQGHLVTVEVTADDPQHLRTLSGRFDAIGTTGTNTLLVRDSTGRVFSLGPAYTADFQPTRAVAHRGPRVTVSRRRVDLAGRALADLDAVVPTHDDGQRARHLLDGQVTLTEDADLTPNEFAFDTVTGSARRLSLQFATLDDLDRLGLAGYVVEAGVVTVRVFLPPGTSEAYTDNPDRSQVRRVVFAHPPHAPPQLYVSEGDSIAVGDTVAVLVSEQLLTARLDAEDALSDLAAVRAEAPPAHSAPVALHARLADAEAEAARAETRHREGFGPLAEVEAARASAAGLRAQVAQAEATAAARANEWQRGHARRLSDAQAHLRRSRTRLAAREREAVILSSGAGHVRRIERRDYGPDRTEVRVVLVSPGTQTHLSPTSTASQSPQGRRP